MGQRWIVFYASFGGLLKFYFIMSFWDDQSDFVFFSRILIIIFQLLSKPVHIITHNRILRGLKFFGFFRTSIAMEYSFGMLPFAVASKRYWSSSQYLSALRNCSLVHIFSRMLLFNGASFITFQRYNWRCLHNCLKIRILSIDLFICFVQPIPFFSENTNLTVRIIFPFCNVFSLVL